jgi:hypothetical protein
MLPGTRPFVPAFQIVCYLINEGIINEMRKKPQTVTLINKTLFFCQERKIREKSAYGNVEKSTK